MHNKPTDQQILATIQAWGNNSMTYVIKNRLQSAGFEVETPWVLRQMKRLEREGKVVRAPSGYAVMLCWTLSSTPDHGDGG